jgi:hypothetical protein
MTESDWKKEWWLDEFNKKFGMAMMADLEGGHFIGSYLLDFIRKVEASATSQGAREERERIIKLAKEKSKDWGDLVVYGNDGIIDALSPSKEVEKGKIICNK